MKINKTEIWFFEKINKIGKPLARSIKEKREESNQENQKSKKSLQQTRQKYRVIRDYYEQLYNNKIDNLEEMDRFLEKFNIPRQNEEEIEIMNNPFTSTETEL